MRTHVSRQIIDNLPRRGPSNSSERKSLHPPIVVAAKRFFEVHRKSVVRDEPVCAALAAGCAARNHQARLTPRVPERLIERGTPDAQAGCATCGIYCQRNLISASAQGPYTRRRAGRFFFRFVQNRIAVIPSVYNRDARNRHGRTDGTLRLLTITLPLSLAPYLFRSLSLPTTRLW